MNKKYIFRTLKNVIYSVLGTKGFKKRCIINFAKEIKNKKILEIGSGKKYQGKYYYSVKKFFDKSNDFIQSDIIKEYGHKIIDITNMKYKNEFDIIICTSVLEHVYDFNKAIENMHKALKNKGILVLCLPLLYPLHDEPNDYWRFTEHSIRKLLKYFSKIKIKYSGIREYPFTYYAEAIK